MESRLEKSWARVAQSVVSDYGLDNRAIGVTSPAEARVFFLPLLCPDLLWGPSSLLSSGYRGVISPGLKRGRGVTLTTHPDLVTRTRVSRSYNSFPPPSAPMACRGTALDFRLEESVNKYIRIYFLRIDNHLNFTLHIEKFIHKWSKACYAVHISNTDTLKSIGFAYFYSIIKYWIISWVTLLTAELLE
jgi:hypothetical protein